MKSMCERDLWSLSRKQLHGLMLGGFAIGCGELANVQYRGVSLGLPRIVERLTWKKFMKVFVSDSNRSWGFNVRLKQNELDGPCAPLCDKAGEPLRFGSYAMRDAAQGEFVDFERRPLVLDYAEAKAARWDPLRCLRDPLVALRRDDPTLLLGMTYVSLAGRRLATPSYFSLSLDGDRSYSW